MNILQDKLPCSENFFRFLANYEKHYNAKNEQPSSPHKTIEIASPKHLKRLSPVKSLMSKQADQAHRK